MNKQLTNTTKAGLLVLLLVCTVSYPVFAADESLLQILPDYNYIFIGVANDDGVKYDFFGDDTYNIRFEGYNRGLNALHISTSSLPADNFGQVTVSTDQSGSFYATDSGGKGYEDDIILMVAVNGTVSDDFSLRITADGYSWMPNPIPNRAPDLATVEYLSASIDETFTSEDFSYGPQIWKPTGNGYGYPIYFGQNMTDIGNTFQIMFIDLNAGVLRPNTALENNGAVRINYTFENLDSFAAFNVYGYCQNSNNGDGMIAWGNALTADKRPSGYSVKGVRLVCMERIGDLKEGVIVLDLHDGIEEALTTKLDEAMISLSDEDMEDPEKTAANVLNAFINQVEAQSGKKIDTDDACALITWAEGIIALLEN